MVLLRERKRLRNFIARRVHGQNNNYTTELTEEKRAIRFDEQR